MRCWKTPDGKLLVEGDAEPHEKAPHAHAYYLIRSDNELERAYKAGSYSMQEDSYRLCYAVDGDRLVCHMTIVGDSGEERRKVSAEIAGLAAAPSLPSGLVEAAAARSERKSLEDAQAAAKAHAVRLDSFRRSLPSYEGKTGLVFAFTYEGAAIAIRGAEGEIVWRDATYPYSGKFIHKELETILKDCYGPRLKGFVLDMPGPEFLNYDPD